MQRVEPLDPDTASSYNAKAQIEKLNEVIEAVNALTERVTGEQLSEAKRSGE